MLALSACSGEEKPAEEAETQNKIAVSLHAVQRQSVSDPVHLSGLLFSDQETRLSFKTGGIIQKTYVKEGDVVKAGQLLALLDMTEIDAQVAQAKQGLDKASRDLERARNLQSEQVATKEQVQNATTAYDVARETVQIAEFNRRFSEVRAPHAGRIVRKLMSEGELAGPGMPIYFMDGQGKAAWVLRAGLADRDWARIKEGDAAQIGLDAYPGEVFSGKVTNKSIAADPSSGSFEVEISLQPTSKMLASGLFAQAVLSPSAREELVCVPPSAIQEGQGKQAYVYTTADGQTAQRRLVRIAFIRADCVAIAQGLEGVTEIITAGSPYLTDGSAIEVVKQ